jgi:hypothetical protein
MYKVYEINDPKELATCRLLWDFLLPQTPRASFFHTWDWLNSYWHHFGNDQKLRILVIHAGGNPLGIVPLCVRRDRYRLGTIRTLTYPLDDWGSWYSPIGPNQAASMLIAMQHIQTTPRDWDLIDLRWTGPESHDGGRPGRAMRVAGYAPQEARLSGELDCGDDWWLESLSAAAAKQAPKRVLQFPSVFEPAGRSPVHPIPAGTSTDWRRRSPLGSVHNVRGSRSQQPERQRLGRKYALHRSCTLIPVRYTRRRSTVRNG